VRGEPVSALYLPLLDGNSWRVTPKVSDRKFPFPELQFARSFHSTLNYAIHFGARVVAT
jgi:hypothetical protein